MTETSSSRTTCKRGFGRNGITFGMNASHRRQAMKASRRSSTATSLTATTTARSSLSPATCRSSGRLPLASLSRFENEAAGCLRSREQSRTSATSRATRSQSPVRLDSTASNIGPRLKATPNGKRSTRFAWNGDRIMSASDIILVVVDHSQDSSHSLLAKWLTNCTTPRSGMFQEPISCFSPMFTRPNGAACPPIEAHLRLMCHQAGREQQPTESASGIRSERSAGTFAVTTTMDSM